LKTDTVSLHPIAFSAVWVASFESLERRLLQGNIHTNADIEDAVMEGAVKRLRPKLMTVVAVLASLAPILWESGIGSDVMKPIAAPIVEA
jgi:copper/silver efflux system protein